MTVETNGPYTETSFRRITAERLSDSGLMLVDALIGAARVLQRHGVCSPLRYADDPPRRIELTNGAITDYLSDVLADRKRGVPTVFRLSGDPADKGSALFLEFESTSAGSAEMIWITLPREFVETTDAAECLSQAIADLSSAYGAYHAAAEDEQLMQLYRGARAAERARSAVPPELRQFIPDSPAPIGAVRFPSLLVPQEFDRRRVPDAVWWINFWDRVQVETIGRSKIRTAPFTRIIDQPSGALVLIATDEAIDVANCAHLNRLARIVEHLDLRGLQEDARFWSGS